MYFLSLPALGSNCPVTAEPGALKANLWHTCQRWHTTMFWMTHQCSPTVNCYWKHVPFSHGFHGLQKPSKNGVYSQLASEPSGNYVRDCALTGFQTLQKSHKSRVYFHTVFWGYRGQKGAFSKAASRRKTLYDLESPQAERECCLKVSGIWQIPRNAGLQGELCHSPRFTCLGEWCKADLWGVSSGARAEIEGLGLLGLYFMPCLEVVVKFHCLG